MATYKFETFNIIFVDPEITINADNISIFPSNMTIDVDILLKMEYNGKMAKFGYRLTDISVENLNYDQQTLGVRVLTKLKEFEV